MKFPRLSPQYVAGLFDGEGCISMGYNKIRPQKSNPNKTVMGFRAVVNIANTFHPVLYLLQDQFGGDVNIEYRNHPHKNQGVWKIHGKQKQKEFLEFILPYSIIKREQIKTGLKIIETIGDPGKRLNQGIWDKRIKLLYRLKQINKKGNGKKISMANVPPGKINKGWNPLYRGYSAQEMKEMTDKMRSKIDYSKIKYSNQWIKRREAREAAEAAKRAQSGG